MSRSYFTIAAALSALVGQLPCESDPLSHEKPREEQRTCVREMHDPATVLLVALSDFKPLEPVVAPNAGHRGDDIKIGPLSFESAPVPGPATGCLLALGALLPSKPSRKPPVRCRCCGRWHTPD